ncbi:MAG: MoxR family ATPase [Chitinophagales bacterium]|jgi:MoxR-like ATPase|nr:MoxR family ATPase [Chitinophagales bacterium]
MNPSLDIVQLNEQIRQDSQFIATLLAEMRKTIVGQNNMTERLLIGLLANGHILLEGVPGLAKTLAIKSLAQAVNAQFSRIQFTPDLLPADLIGTMVYSPQDGKFSVKKGPVFANFILADEINRAPGKVQSALLEAMQERQVTIGGTTYPLPEPFLVLATQNPLEQGGTYPLPEAQLDRFMLKVIISYPSKAEEQQILRQNVQTHSTSESIQPVLDAASLLAARQTVKAVYMDEKIENYIINLVFASRYPEQHQLSHLKNYINYGASPRASINLALAAKAYAFIKQRGFVIPEDVRSVAHDVLRHRIGITYEAEADNVTAEQIINDLLKVVDVP